MPDNGVQKTRPNAKANGVFWSIAIHRPPYETMFYFHWPLQPSSLYIERILTVNVHPTPWKQLFSVDDNCDVTLSMRNICRRLHQLPRVRWWWWPRCWAGGHTSHRRICCSWQEEVRRTVRSSQRPPWHPRDAPRSFPAVCRADACRLSYANRRRRRDVLIGEKDWQSGCRIAREDLVLVSSADCEASRLNGSCRGSAPTFKARFRKQWISAFPVSARETRKKKKKTTLTLFDPPCWWLTSISNRCISSEVWRHRKWNKKGLTRKVIPRRIFFYIYTIRGVEVGNKNE